MIHDKSSHPRANRREQAQVARVWLAVVLTLVLAWVIPFPLAHVLSRHTSLGAHGIWWAHPISIALSATICVLWFLSGD